jgi:spermidine synthase
VKASGRRKAAAQGEIGVSESGGVRYLHLGNDAVQSAMRIRRPFDLELSYTRAMMGGLMLHPSPRHFCMIGLGGGSIAKFVHRHLPEASIRVVELNPNIAAVARSEFGLPPDDPRLSIEIGDGAAFVSRVALSGKPCADLLLVDGFDSLAQVQSLATRPFYDSAIASLRPGGILVVNLLQDDPGLDRYVRRIERASPGGTLCLEAEDEPNLIVFGFRDAIRGFRVDDLYQRAIRLQRATGLAFPVLLKGLRALNRTTRTLLKVRPRDAATA